MDNGTTQTEAVKVTSNILWRLAERFGVEGIHFVVSVILTRLLTPDEFGLSSLVMVFVSIFGVFLTSGLRTALVQRKDVDIRDYETALWANVGFAVVLYIFVFLIAPLLAKWFDQPQMTLVMRVLGLSLFIGGVNSVPAAQITRNMEFRKFFRVTLTGTIVSGVVGVGMALSGMGVWSLVGQHLCNLLVNMVMLWKSVHWLPSGLFSIQRLKPLFEFGWKAYLSSLIDAIYQNLRTLVIGGRYTSDMVAFYNRGHHIPLLMNSCVNSAIQSVIFPAYSQYRDDKVKIRQMMRKSVTLSTYVVFPCMMGLALVAEPLITLMYTERWLPCVPYLQIGCFVYALNPIHSVNLQAILSIGRSDISLKVEIFKKVITVTCLLICMNISVFATAFSAAPLGVFALIVNTLPVNKEFYYSLGKQLRDILPNIALTALMGVMVYMTGLLDVGHFSRLLLQVLVGVSTYVLFSLLTKNESFCYVFAYLRRYMFKKLKPSK